MAIEDEIYTDLCLTDHNGATLISELSLTALSSRPPSGEFVWPSISHRKDLHALISRSGPVTVQPGGAEPRVHLAAGSANGSRACTLGSSARQASPIRKSVIRVIR